jgi:hypothetical protein
MSIMELVKKNFHDKFFALNEKMKEVNFYNSILKDEEKCAQVFLQNMSANDFLKFVEKHTPSDNLLKTKWFDVCSLLAKQLEDWNGENDDFQKLITLKKIKNENTQEAKKELEKTIEYLKSVGIIRKGEGVKKIIK